MRILCPGEVAKCALVAMGWPGLDWLPWSSGVLAAVVPEIDGMSSAKPGGRPSSYVAPCSNYPLHFFLLGLRGPQKSVSSELIGPSDWSLT